MFRFYFLVGFVIYSMYERRIQIKREKRNFFYWKFRVLERVKMCVHTFFRLKVSLFILRRLYFFDCCSRIKKTSGWYGFWAFRTLLYSNWNLFVFEVLGGIERFVLLAFCRVSKVLYESNICCIMNNITIPAVFG